MEMGDLAMAVAIVRAIPETAASRAEEAATRAEAAADTVVSATVAETKTFLGIN